MDIPLFYDDRNIYWVFDTFGAAGVDKYLQQQIFDPQHINEVFDLSSLPNHPARNSALTKLLAPYIDLDSKPEVVRALQQPQGLGVREYILEKSPHLTSILGPSYQNLDARELTLMWDLANVSSKHKDIIDAAGSLDVIMDDDLFDKTVHSISNPEIFSSLLCNAVFSPWSNLDNLTTVLKCAPQHIVNNHLTHLMCLAGQKTPSNWPNAKARSAEQIVDALLPYVEPQQLQQWIDNDDIAAEVVHHRQHPNQRFEHTYMSHMFDNVDEQDITAGPVAPSGNFGSCLISTS